MSQLFQYLLALGTQRFGLLLHAACVMGNHYHVVGTDVEGQHPRFTQWFNSLLARAINRVRRRRDTFWDGAQVNVVELGDREAVVDAIAYTLANPVAAGAVARGRDWPGLRTTPQMLAGAPRVVRRPDVFFAPDCGLPEEVELRLVPPPDLDDLAADEVVALVGARVAALESGHRETRRTHGKGFLGSAAVRRKRWQDAPPGDPPPVSVRPTVAASSSEARLALLSRIASFRAAYAEALAALRQGAADVVFPHGTWALRLLAGVPCHAPP